MPTQNFAIAPRIPKPKRVVFDLTTSTRTRNAFGPDFFSQVLYLKLDGISNERIAQVMGCCVDTVSDAITTWQAGVAAKEGDGWQPRDRNPRKTRFLRSPTPKF